MAKKSLTQVKPGHCTSHCGGSF